MTECLVLDICGVPVQVLTGGGDTPLRAALGPTASPARWDEQAVTVVVPRGDAETVLATGARAAVEQSPHLLLHCGAVVRAGRAVLIPGESGTGKSTLTAACVRHGFDYLTDEMTAVDLTSGKIAGWARPLMLTPWSARVVGLTAGGTTGESMGDQAGEHTGKVLVRPEELGRSATDRWLPVADVVVVRRGASETGLTPMPSGEIVRTVLAASFNHYLHGVRAWEAAARLAQVARGWWLDLADPMSGAAALAALPELDGRTPATTGATQSAG